MKLFRTEPLQGFRISLQASYSTILSMLEYSKEMGTPASSDHDTEPESEVPFRRSSTQVQKDSLLHHHPDPAALVLYHIAKKTMELVACAVVGGALVYTGLVSSEFGAPTPPSARDVLHLVSHLISGSWHATRPMLQTFCCASSAFTNFTLSPVCITGKGLGDGLWAEKKLTRKPAHQVHLPASSIASLLPALHSDQNHKPKQPFLCVGSVRKYSISHIVQNINITRSVELSLCAWLWPSRLWS